MDDSKHLLERAQANAPEAGFDLEDVRERGTPRATTPDRRCGRRVGPYPCDRGRRGVRHGLERETARRRDAGGGSLPAPHTVPLGPGEYSTN